MNADLEERKRKKKTMKILKKKEKITEVLKRQKRIRRKEGEPRTNFRPFLSPFFGGFFFVLPFISLAVFFLPFASSSSSFISSISIFRLFPTPKTSTAALCARRNVGRRQDQIQENAYCIGATGIVISATPRSPENAADLHAAARQSTHGASSETEATASKRTEEN